MAAVLAIVFQALSFFHGGNPIASPGDGGGATPASSPIYGELS